MTIICLRQNFHRDTTPVPFISTVTVDYNCITSQFVPRPRQLSKNICIMTPKTTPYLPSAFYREPAPPSSCLGTNGQVTPTCYTGGPLAASPSSILTKAKQPKIKI